MTTSRHTDRISESPRGGRGADRAAHRSVLSRSAAGAGIALSGGFTGLFGAGASPAAAHDGAGATAHGHAGYGPLVDDPAGLLSLPENRGCRVSLDAA